MTELKKNLNYSIGSYGHMYSRMQEVEFTRDVDILFLGSSHAYRGFDTRIFESHGFKTFNFGSSSQTPIQTRYLLNKYLHSLNPKLVIYEVFPEPFTSDGVESTLDIIANGEIDFELIKMALGQNHIKVYNTLIYGIYCALFGRNKDFKEDVVKNDDLYIRGGFVLGSMKYFKHVPYGTNQWHFSDNQLQIFRNIISDFKERGIPFVLVQAPITKSRYVSYSNNTEFDKLMNDFGPYYNFNEIIELDDEFHFYDDHHLNQQGVVRFNEQVIALLKEHKNMRSSRARGSSSAADQGRR